MERPNVGCYAVHGEGDHGWTRTEKPGLLRGGLNRFRIRRGSEMPAALLILGVNNRRNIIPATVETHVTCHAVVFVNCGHLVMNAVAVRSGFLDRGDEHLRAVVSVTGVDIRFHAVTL